MDPKILLKLGNKMTKILIILIGSICLWQSTFAAPSARIICRPEQSCTVHFKTPWMVALKTNKEPFFCGGTLISPYWILTAAHCTKDENGNYIQANDMQVILGRKNITDTEFGEVIEVEKIIRHPDYEKGNDENPLADIALLKLKQPSKQQIMPIADKSLVKECDLTTILDWRNTEKICDLATIIGWGVTKDGDISDILRHTSMPIVSNKTCQIPYGKDINESMLCADFYDGGTDGCEADSGGPLLIKHNNEWQQVGIMSWGDDCAKPKHYGVYTRITSFLDFIDVHVKDSCEIPPILQVNMENVEITWHSECDIKGYKLYLAPYSDPINEVTINNIISYDMGYKNKINLNLPIPNIPVKYHKKLYVAVKSYILDDSKNRIYSNYSNLEVITLDSKSSN